MSRFAIISFLLTVALAARVVDFALPQGAQEVLSGVSQGLDHVQTWLEGDREFVKEQGIVCTYIYEKVWVSVIDIIIPQMNVHRTLLFPKHISFVSSPTRLRSATTL